MSNKVAQGIVLVPCLLLGGAFLSSAVWSPGILNPNRLLAIGLGVLLIITGIIAQLLSSQDSLEDKDSGNDISPDS